MGTFPLSIVPRSTLGIEAHCAWAPEPVFTLEESARILGTNKHHLKVNVRRRYLEVRLPKGVLNLSTPFGPTLTEFGEITISLETPGGSQEHVCLTHYGLFRHAIYIRTPEARRYAIHYPEFLRALSSGQFRAPVKIVERYRYVLEAPFGHRSARIREVCGELGKSRNTIWRHINQIALGHVTPEGLPILRRPGPPKGFRSKLTPEMQTFIFELHQSGVSKVGCRQALVAKFGAGPSCPSLDSVRRFLI